MHFGIERLQVFFVQEVVAGIGLGVQRADAQQLLENHRRKQVVDRKRIVRMRLQRRLELADRLVVIEVVEVVEALAGVGVIGGPGGNPGASVSGRMPGPQSTAACSQQHTNESESPDDHRAATEKFTGIRQRAFIGHVCSSHTVEFRSLNPGLAVYVLFSSSRNRWFIGPMPFPDRIRCRIAFRTNSFASPTASASRARGPARRPAPWRRRSPSRGSPASQPRLPGNTCSVVPPSARRSGSHWPPADVRR